MRMPGRVSKKCGEGKEEGAAARRDDWRTPKRKEGPMAKYVTVVLDIPPEEWKFSGYARSVLTKLTNNAHVPNPTPSLAVYGGHVALLLEAEAGVTNGVPGAVKACAAAKEKVKEDLNHLRDAVQLAVEALVGGTDLKGIEVIVESTGMRLKKRTPRAKYDYELAPGDADGSLVCTAPSSPARDTHEWDYSTDQKTRIFLSGTRKARVTFTGLPIGVQLYVRHRQLTKDGYTEWLDPPLVITLK
jgi:hypothetical protein